MRVLAVVVVAARASFQARLCASPTAVFKTPPGPLGGPLTSTFSDEELQVDLLFDDRPVAVRQGARVSQGRAALLCLWRGAFALYRKRHGGCYRSGAP